jgi:SAM-dependent methyltransferase
MYHNNSDPSTVDGFGDEWERFDQSELTDSERNIIFEHYFNIFPWELLSANSVGFDMGCGSGRWAKLVAPRVGILHCIDPSSAIEVAKRNLSDQRNCIFHKCSVNDRIIPEDTMDFGYSLGVLHHVPNTLDGIRECVRMLKPGAPLLIYLYYALDNRSFSYRLLWKISDYIRRFVSIMPYSMRYITSQFIAFFVYLPLARFAFLMEKLGMSCENASALPLGFYRNNSFYTMRTDALDRFGTRLEQRFTREDIQIMMEVAGLGKIRFSEHAPYWCAVGFKGQ